MKNQKTFFTSLDTSTTTYSRIFCRKVIPLFAKQASKGEKDSSTEGEKKFLMIKIFSNDNKDFFPILKYLIPVIIFQVKSQMLAHLIHQKHPAFLI